ncbi:MAG: 3-dehydroquinate synthase family protein [Bacillota bacterium]|nr:3-dehydroquinate synthase family protein [Bacillota bacterium]
MGEPWQLEAQLPGRDVRLKAVAGGGLLADLSPFLPQDASVLFLVTSPPLWELYGEVLVKALQKRGFPVGKGFLPDGEAAKNPESLANLYEEALAVGLDREGLLLALGGGTVLDAAGFMASTYLRGIRSIYLPSTLLSQVDAALGGKTAINLPKGKNLVGTFYWPEGILCDVRLLRSLPARLFAEGMAEAIKHGLISGAPYYDIPLEGRTKLLRREEESLQALVAGSLAIKGAIVLEDPWEKGKRRHLNLGHTVAHALEAAAGYGAFSHGEAVAMGLVAEGQLALRVGTGWSAAEQKGLLERLQAWSLPTGLPRDLLPKLPAFWQRDKKKHHGRLRWVLPMHPGALQERDDLPDGEVLKILEEVAT